MMARRGYLKKGERERNREGKWRNEPKLKGENAGKCT